MSILLSIICNSEAHSVCFVQLALLSDADMSISLCIICNSEAHSVCFVQLAMLYDADLSISLSIISRVPDQNGVSQA